MTRRYMLSLCAGASLCAAHPALAQVPRQVRVGGLTNLNIFNPLDPLWFTNGMRRLGWESGRDLDMDWRFANNDPHNFHRFAKELVARRVDLLFAIGDDALEAAYAASRTVPIVTIAAAVVETGYAKSLAAPGGNVTGVVSQALDFVGKSFELLRTLRPDLRRVGVSHRPGHRLSDLWLEAWQSAARGTGAVMVALPFLREQADIEPMLAVAQREKVQALVGEGPVPVLLGSGFEKIQAWATAHGVLTYTTTWVRGEHLLSFGPDPWDLRRLAMAQIDRVLRGASPSQVPITQPTKFELILNQRIARSMGLGIPTSLLLRADEVIQ